MTDGPPPADRPAFAHASEAELARILDFYAVGWAYEPDTFPIAWNLDGDVIESFAPDFYLPDFELYVELTTLKQKLVRKKNRKLRRLRELYPGIRIKLFYARDFRMLLLKFGRLALHDELSGTTGQATPPRPVAETERESGGDLAAAIGASPDVDPEEADLRSAAPIGTREAAILARTAREGRGRRRGKRRRHASSQAAPTLPGAGSPASGADPGAQPA
jgi:hypothetical protein